jgi:hypothetical protein
MESERESLDRVSDLGSFWMMPMKNLRREGEEEVLGREYTSCRFRVSFGKRGNVALYWS